jgi:hypothetical protein
VEQETLVPIPENEVDEKQDGEQEKEELKSEVPSSVKSELESVPGTVLTTRVLVIPPRTEKRFYAAVTGLPRGVPNIFISHVRDGVPHLKLYVVASVLDPDPKVFGS